MEESVWSVVRQDNEHGHQWEAYSTVLRPALVSGADAWALKMAQQNKLEVAET